MESETDRRLSARVLSILLATSAAVELGGIVFALRAPANVDISGGLLASFHAVAAAVAGVAAVMEGRRARLGEVASVLAAAAGTALTWLAVVNGWFYYAPILGVATLAVFLALANRAMVRDELRHQPRKHPH